MEEEKKKKREERRGRLVSLRTVHVVVPLKLQIKVEVERKGTVEGVLK